MIFLNFRLKTDTNIPVLRAWKSTGGTDTVIISRNLKKTVLEGIIISCFNTMKYPKLLIYIKFDIKWILIICENIVLNKNIF